jgi:hypothetical protein
MISGEIWVFFTSRPILRDFQSPIDVTIAVVREPQQYRPSTPWPIVQWIQTFLRWIQTFLRWIQTGSCAGYKRSIWHFTTDMLR